MQNNLDAAVGIATLTRASITLKKLAKAPNYFKEKAMAYRHLTLLRTKKHLKDYFEEIKKEAEKKKKNKTSKRSIDNLSYVFEYALRHDSLLTKGLEEHLHVHQLKESAYNLRSTQVQCNVESF